MTSLLKKGETHKPDFIEEDFISALETGLNRTFYYKDKSVGISRISQADENELGYDGVLTTIVPFYIQFKRSYFFTPSFSGKLLSDRNKISLPTQKGFFAFELLKKENGYKQHNVMHELSQKHHAAYVAPLFYKKQDLLSIKQYREDVIPTHFHNIIILDSSSYAHNFDNVKVFKNSLTIPPHSKIYDKNTSHHYSYCKELKVGFHSKPENLMDSSSETLNSFLKRISEHKNTQLEENTNNLFNSLPLYLGFKSTKSKNYKSILSASINRISTTDVPLTDNVFSNLTTIDKLLITEDILQHYLNIWQFIKYNPIF
ncbi:hypothetical protein [Hymenobacter sp. CRA2]|uniref:hypothetical protein n=1 Tax=Hymenobacter sp. CRA2 TaxID=1955620 RepID=UPI0011165FBC|nr:hypothetical protein [Hymenobacter sp. CRA2]